MSNATSNPQTVYFMLSCEYDHIDTLAAGKPNRQITEWESFEDMLSHARKERKRRSYADRSTGAQYRMVLTDLGVERCNACEYTAKSHESAINGTWNRI